MTVVLFSRKGWFSLRVYPSGTHETRRMFTHTEYNHTYALPPFWFNVTLVYQHESVRNVEAQRADPSVS